MYPNPEADDESDEEEYYPQHISQTAGYYRTDGGTPASSNNQVRLHQIPVQHISTSTRQPHASQSGTVYSGIASSVPMSARSNNQNYRAVQESDYVNAPAAVTSQSSEFYSEEDDFIPPAIPSKVSYGSLSSSTHTPEIKGPQYNIAPEVYGNQPPAPSQPAIPSSRSYHGHYPEPVSSKLMYTTPVAPAAQGFVESRHKNAPPSGGGGPPPPTYDTQSNYPPKESSMSYPSNYSSPGQQSVPKSALYNYPSEHEAVAPGSGGDKKEAEVDALTQMLMQNMEAAADPDFFGKISLLVSG